MARAVSYTHLDVYKRQVMYNGIPACTVYGSASAGVTNSSQNMGWNSQPYLVNVTSPYESMYGAAWQNKTNTIGIARMKDNIENKLGISTAGYDYTNWLTNPVFDQYGYCTQITVCGKVVSGGKFYENCYGLYSPNSVSYTHLEEEKVSLCVMDDVFPHPASGFRLAEYKAYLDAFEKVRVVCSGHSVAMLGEESITDLCKDFVQAHPEYSDEITIDDHLPRNAHIDLAYFGFLENVWPHLDELEERAIPFVLELYPGGGFARFNPEVDHKLRLVLSSPCLRKVITTQPATTRYLLEKNFCSPDQILSLIHIRCV